jgi:hypothetical protein
MKKTCRYPNPWEKIFVRRELTSKQELLFSITFRDIFTKMLQSERMGFGLSKFKQEAFDKSLNQLNYIQSTVTQTEFDQLCFMVFGFCKYNNTVLFDEAAFGYFTNSKGEIFQIPIRFIYLKDPNVEEYVILVFQDKTELEFLTSLRVSSAVMENEILLNGVLYLDNLCY